MVCRSLYVLLLWSWYRRKAWAEQRGGRVPVGFFGGGKLKSEPDTVPGELTCLESWGSWFCCCGRGFLFNLLAGLCDAMSEGLRAWCKMQLAYCWGIWAGQKEHEMFVEAETERRVWSQTPGCYLDYDALAAEYARVRAQLNAYYGAGPDVRWWQKLWHWPLSGETEAQKTVNTLHKDIEAHCEEAQVLAGIVERASGSDESARASKEQLEKLKQASKRAGWLPGTASLRVLHTKPMTSELESIEQTITEAKGPTKTTRPTASELIADELSRRLTWSALYVSVAADIDLALDWIFLSQLVRRSRDSSKATFDPDEANEFCDNLSTWTVSNVATVTGFCDNLQGDFIPPRFMIVAAVFAALGTVLWAFAAFDLVAWGLDYISLGLFNRAPSPDLYPSRGVVLLLNLALEDVPQIVISSVVTAHYDGGGDAISSLALANIVTSVYSLLFKVMATFESSAGEYTIPAMINVAPLARGEMEQRRRAREASSRTAREYAVAAANQMRLLEGTFDKDELELDAWSDVPPADTMRGGAWRRQLRDANTIQRIRIQKLRGPNEVTDVFEVLNHENSSIVTLDLAGPSSSEDTAIDKPGISKLAEALRENGTLTTLVLDNNSIDDAGAQALAEALETNVALTRLRLRGNSIGDVGMQALVEALVKSLEKKSARTILCTLQTIADVLETNNTLMELDLNGRRIGDAGAQALAEALKTSGALKTLSLNSNSIGDAGAQALAEALKTNGALTTLWLRSNSIRDAGAQALAEALKTNGALTTLWLSYNSIGEAGAQALAERLKTNGALKALWLSSNSIGDAGAQALAEALKTNEALTELYLSNNSIGEAGARALAEALKTNGALTTFDLHSNSIGDDGAQALAEALKTNGALTELGLSHDSIGDAGAQALAETLKTNEALTELYLSYNSIGDAGAQALADALETNGALKALYLSNNSIDEVGAQALAEALQTNGALTELWLSSNSIGEAGAQALAEALKTNGALTRLDLDNNSIGDDGAQALDEAERAPRADGRDLTIWR